MYFFVATSYRQEISFLNQHNHYTYHAQDKDWCHFLKEMCCLYCSLTSQNDPDIFNINRDQKIELNKFIHFARKNWEVCQDWYLELWRSTINNNSSFYFVCRSWQHIKPLGSNFDYVQDIRNKNDSKPRGNAS